MHKCNLCTKEFETATQLGGHRSVHVRRGELQKGLNVIMRRGKTCPICNNSFPKTLGSHILTHQRTVEDLTHPGAIKRKLLEEIGHHCENCGNTEWLNKPIPLQLDHRDGDPDNKLRENLRLLCPNCHAQTPTYCGRNIGRPGGIKRKEIMKNRKPYR